MRNQYEVDDRDYGLDEIDITVTKVRAVCTSDECRLKGCKSPNGSDVGVVKNVRKTADTCPDCDYYLFWEKYYA